MKNFSQNSLILLQIFNGFSIFYCATWDVLIKSVFTLIELKELKEFFDRFHQILLMIWYGTFPKKKTRKSH
jgi:hypothetical protein